MIERLRIRKFKGLADLTLELDRINVLVGGNNAGKSSVLQAVQFMVSLAQSAKLAGARWGGETLSTSLSAAQLIYAPLRDVEMLALGRLAGTNGIRVDLDGSAGDGTKLQVRKGKNRNISVRFEGKNLGQILQPLNRPFSVIVPGLAGIPLAEQKLTPGVVQRATARGDANSVFRNVLHLLSEDTARWAAFTADLGAVFPGHEIRVQFNPVSDETISAYLIRAGADLPLDAAGTGVLQTIQILAYVHLYAPRVLLLDEPDAHLHADNQRRLATVLAEISGRGEPMQVIVSTHSKHLMEAMADSDAATPARVHWLRAGEVQPREATDAVSVLMDLGALDRAAQLAAGRRQALVLTEDKDVSVVRALLQAAGFQMAETEVWSYKGATNVDVLETLANFAREHFGGVQVVVHRDRDYLDADEVERYRKRVAEAAPHASVFVTTGTDAESEFLKAGHLEALFGIVPAEGDAMIEGATQDARNDSISRMADHRSLVMRKKNPQSNPTGKLALECPRDFDQDPVRWRYGKKAAASLQQSVHQWIAGRYSAANRPEANLFQPSAHVRHSELSEIAVAIWAA